MPQFQTITPRLSTAELLEESSLALEDLWYLSEVVNEPRAKRAYRVLAQLADEALHGGKQATVHEIKQHLQLREILKTIRTTTLRYYGLVYKRIEGQSRSEKAQVALAVFAEISKDFLDPLFWADAVAPLSGRSAKWVMRNLEMNQPAVSRDLETLKQHCYAALQKRASV